MSVNVELIPELDLVLERVVDVSPELIWKGWGTCLDQLVAYVKTF